MSNDSTIFDSGTENIYVDSIEPEIGTMSAASLQWVSSVTEQEYDENEKLIRSVHTIYEIPDVPVWEAFPPIILGLPIEENDEEPAQEPPEESRIAEKAPAITLKERVQRNKTVFSVLDKALRASGLADLADGGLTEEVFYHLHEVLTKEKLELRLYDACDR